jgi:hypothetical protein
MKLNRYAFFSALGALTICGIVGIAGQRMMCASTPKESPRPAAKAPAAAAPAAVKMQRPKHVRGIHLTAWVAGSPSRRAAIDQLIDETELNTVVVDIKEYEGEVYIPGIPQAEQCKSFVNAIPDAEKYVAHLKSKGIYPIARIVVFKDNVMPRRKPSLGVKDTAGNLWKDRKGITWLDPYSKESWDYNLDIAERAIDLGFEEIQFDYIRFPSDGNINTCRYSQVHTSTSSAAALVNFLKEANRRLKPRGVDISIDVFGLTTTVQHDMGIGQKIIEMSEWVDYVSPMVYPSHYAKGEYRIADPNKAPYKTVFLGLEGAKKRMGEHAVKLRPYLQDFSLGYHYGAKEVRDQIQATYDNDMGDWLLWNPRCVYTRGALKGREAEDSYEKKAPPEGMFTAPEPKVKKNPVGHVKKTAPARHAGADKKLADAARPAPAAGAADLKSALEPGTTTH